MSDALHWLPWMIAAYVIGSTPVGLLIGRLRGIDIREHGSKNIGATNVTRVLGRPLGVTCFILDFLKGAAPVVLAALVMDVWTGPKGGAQSLSAHVAWLWIGVAGAGVAGHMFSFWLRFKGGKGVATGFGAMCGLWPFVTVPALAALLIWILLAAITRYVSVASCAAAGSLPLLVLAWRLVSAGGGDAVSGAWPFVLATTALGAVVIWKHRANIARLRAGTESRIGAGRAHHPPGAPPTGGTAPTTPPGR